ncbi:WW domain protein [Aspergillus novofumigatus IBT 16806]|uniref:WW domain-containing protein n=1 Tax=Aspergillus novofumigatus (strain IBT 16806) TaxID=1392255 RepID=A0A2I1C714_ASPN1|nr:uncharacterized protein P174DRAFT_432706 [Aspergillus novofumigatus IBT 16806]PKX93405.1 hypothetical protein P174DRAFT_432706 [Aspergillus novofumigatus IBT 16806]
MSYYGERDTYYGGPPQPTYGRPPYDRPPTSNSNTNNHPTTALPTTSHPRIPTRTTALPTSVLPRALPLLLRPIPPPLRGTTLQQLLARSLRPSTPNPPPPLPHGWVQEWEPSLRRAYFVETATGRSQWETPMQDSEHARGLGGPPPESAGYYASPPPPPPQDGGYYPPAGQYPPPEEKKKSSGVGKIIAGGVAGVALGAAGMALWEHEKREDEEEEELKERVERLEEEEQYHSGSSSDHERAHSPALDDW